MCCCGALLPRKSFWLRFGTGDHVYGMVLFGGVNTKCHFIATRTSLPRRLGETHLQMRQSQTGVFGFFFAAPYTWREIVYQLPVILPSGAFNKFAANICLMTEMSYRTHVVWWPGSAAAHTKKSEVIWSPQRHGTSIFVIFAAC